MDEPRSDVAPTAPLPPLDPDATVRLPAAPFDDDATVIRPRRATAAPAASARTAPATEDALPIALPPGYRLHEYRIDAVLGQFARGIVRPICRLIDAPEALKRGDYDAAQVRVNAGDEIGALGRTVNVMIDVLRQRQRERSLREPGRR